MIWGVRSAEVELWKHRLFLSDFCVVWAPSPMSGGYIAQDPQSCRNSLKTQSSALNLQ